MVKNNTIIKSYQYFVMTSLTQFQANGSITSLSLFLISFVLIHFRVNLNNINNSSDFLLVNTDGFLVSSVVVLLDVTQFSPKKKTGCRGDQWNSGFFVNFLCNISIMRDSVSAGYPNTERRVVDATCSGVFLTKFVVFG